MRFVRCRERQMRCLAFLSFRSEFAAGHVCSLLRHQAVCHQFAAGDGDESLHAVAFGMVEGILCRG